MPIMGADCNPASGLVLLGRERKLSQRIQEWRGKVRIMRFWYNVICGLCAIVNGLRAVTIIWPIDAILAVVTGFTYLLLVANCAKDAVESL